LEDAIARHKAQGANKQIGLRDVAPRWWPTPHTSLDKGAGHRNPEKGPNLQTAAQNLWPTPEGIRDAKSSGTKALLDKRLAPSALGQPLVEVACHWPTPRACSGERSSGLNRTEMVNAWKTPSVQASGHGYTRRPDRKNEQVPTLIGQAMAWTTPRASDGAKGGPNQSFGAGGVPLVTQACSHFSRQDLQTAPDGPPSSRAARNSHRPSLNPSFVEWLMGWPVNWTVPVPGALGLASTGSALRETAWSLWLQQQRTALSGLSWNYAPATEAEPEPMQMELLP
jgi:hypothetical protein